MKVWVWCHSRELSNYCGGEEPGRTSFRRLVVAYDEGYGKTIAPPPPRFQDVVHQTGQWVVAELTQVKVCEQCKRPLGD